MGACVDKEYGVHVDRQADLQHFYLRIDFLYVNVGASELLL